MKRINKGLTENIYLMNVDDDNKTYTVMSQSQNIYNIVVINEKDDSNILKCSCPDHMYRKKRCKHIYFVLIKILNIIDYDQKTYTEEELVYNKNVLNTIELKCEDDFCPICLDELNTKNNKCSYCISCNRLLHTSCYDMWKTYKNTCVYCKKEHTYRLLLQDNDNK